MCRIIFLLNRSGLLILLLFVVGCVYGTINPGDVKEYRYFPEYKGYFPISDNTVRADWVLPELTSEGKIDYTPPSTHEEAEQRVKEVVEREKKLHPFFKDVFLFPLQVALLPPYGIPLSFAMYPFMYPFFPNHPEKLEREQLTQLENFAGIKIKIQVVDTAGIAVPSARVLEVVSPVKIPVFADQQGNRSFALPTFHSYIPNTNMLELSSSHLPICLGTGVKNHDITRCKDIFNQRTDQSGKVTYISLAASQFAYYSKKEEKWFWACSPTSLTLHFILWAPGFKPAIYSVKNVNPKDELNIAPVLELLPDGTRIKKTSNDIEKIPELISEAVHTKTGKTEIDAIAVGKITQDLEKWIQDETLPSYIRWNAFNLLDGILHFRPLYEDTGKSISDSILMIEEPWAALIVKPTLDRVEEKAKSFTPYLADTPYNPWSFKERYEKMLGSKITIDIVDEASDLLSKGEAIDPNLPELDHLRAIIALAEGDRVWALTFSGYLNHFYFFRMFYGLSIIEPQY